MITLHEKARRAKVLMQDGKPLAVARYNQNYGWLMTAYGFSWTDKRAQVPNIAGKIYPNLMRLKHAKDVRKIMMDMVTKNGA